MGHKLAGHIQWTHSSTQMNIAVAAHKHGCCSVCAAAWRLPYQPRLTIIDFKTGLVRMLSGHGWQTTDASVLLPEL
jgi:predicted  nucleic acid-binding Zn ribbon protein